jgi:DNA-binding NtrC family response regulator
VLQTARPPPAPPVSPDPSVVPRKRTLLIVEDEQSLLRAFSLAFERAGAEVLAAADVPAALAHWRARRDAIDLILSDVQMPGPPIEVLIAEVKQHAPALPILLMSGELRGSEKRITDLMRSVDGFLAKPLRIEALKVEIERRLKLLPPR